MFTRTRGLTLGPLVGVIAKGPAVPENYPKTLGRN